MGVQERRAREKQELRQEILQAARELFVRDGFENVSMRKIAEKIEYSPTTIYLYFQDKADLLDCVCDETLLKLAAELGRLWNLPGEPLERLRRGMKAYIEFGLEHPDDYRVAFMTYCPTPPEQPTRCSETGEKAFDYMRRGVSECVEAGVFRPVDVEATSQALWAAIHGLTALFVTYPEYTWVERTLLIDTLLDGTIGGFRARTHTADYSGFKTSLG